MPGPGGHAAHPRHTPDANLAANLRVTPLNTIFARRIEGGQSHNVRPAEVPFTGTGRSFDVASQDRIGAALCAAAAGVALART